MGNMPNTTLKKRPIWAFSYNNTNVTSGIINSGLSSWHSTSLNTFLMMFKTVSTSPPASPQPIRGNPIRFPLDSSRINLKLFSIHLMLLIWVGCSICVHHLIDLWISIHLMLLIWITCSRGVQHLIKIYLDGVYRRLHRILLSLTLASQPTKVTNLLYGEHAQHHLKEKAHMGLFL